MRMNIEVDPSLIEEALRYAKVRTKKDLVELALREFVARRRGVRELLEAVGIRDDYDHKRLRIGARERL